MCSRGCFHYSFKTTSATPKHRIIDEERCALDLVERSFYFSSHFVQTRLAMIFIVLLCWHGEERERGIQSTGTGSWRKAMARNIAISTAMQASPRLAIIAVIIFRRFDYSLDRVGLRERGISHQRTRS